MIITKDENRVTLSNLNDLEIDIINASLMAYEHSIYQCQQIEGITAQNYFYNFASLIAIKLSKQLSDFMVKEASK